MTRRNFKIDDLIGPHAILCKYGCGTMLTFNREFKVHQEQWSNIIHSKYRCNYIKAKNKTEKDGFNPKVPRLDVVMELREVIDKLKEGTEITKQMFLLLRSRKTREDAATLKELALALHPSQFYIDKNGEKQPTPESIASTSSAIARVKDRKGRYMGTVAACSLYYKLERQNRYYDFKVKEEFKPVRQKGEKHAAGILASLKATEETIERDPVEREWEARTIENEILNGAANNNSKKKKKRDGGNGNGEGVL